MADKLHKIILQYFSASFTVFSIVLSYYVFCIFYFFLLKLIIHPLRKTTDSHTFDNVFSRILFSNKIIEPIDELINSINFSNMLLFPYFWSENCS